MKKKYYILVLTFFCILCGQASYAFTDGEGWGDFNHDGIPDIFKLDDVTIGGSGQQCYSCDCDSFFCFGGNPDNVYPPNPEPVPNSGDPCDPGSVAYDPDVCGGNGNTVNGNSLQGVGKAYVPKPDDKKIPSLITSMPIQVKNTCVTSSLEYISKMLGKTINEGVFVLNLLTKGTIVFRDGVSLQQINQLINTYFNTAPFSNFINAIDSGYSVMTNMYVSPTNTHNVVVVGYQTDGDLIYMDPEKGTLQEAPAVNFNYNYAILIQSVK